MKPLILRSEMIPESPVTSTERIAQYLDQAIVFGLVALILFGALSFGAVQDWSVFVLRTVSVVLFLLWVTEEALRGSLHIRVTSVFAPAAAFFVLGLLQLLSGLTAYRHDTLVELLNYAAYGILAFLAIQAVTTAKRAEFLTVSFGIIGFALAVFAIIQAFSFNGKIYWLIGVPQGAVVFGPYVNHNHYAGLMEMLMPFPLVEAMDNSTSQGRRFLAGFFVVVMAVSVLLSLSRGGILAIIIEFALMFLLLRVAKQQSSSTRILFALLIVVGLMLVWIGNTNVVPRLASLGEPGRADVAGWRLRVVMDSFTMVRDKPLLGWGLGTFPTAYPRFRSFYENAFVNQAHNDYAQLLVEMGIFGFAIFAWFLWKLMQAAWRQLSSNGAHWRSMLTAASLIGITGILVHSMSDFNLHIPINAAMFYILCALASVEKGAERRNSMSLIRPA